MRIGAGNAHSTPEAVAFPTADPAVGWGLFAPRQRVAGFHEFHPGRLYLMRTAWQGCYAHNIMEVVAIDPHGLGMRLLLARMVEPADVTRCRAGASSYGFAVWAHELELGGTEYFHTEQPSATRAAAVGCAIEAPLRGRYVPRDGELFASAH